MRRRRAGRWPTPSTPRASWPRLLEGGAARLTVECRRRRLADQTETCRSKPTQPWSCWSRIVPSPARPSGSSITRPLLAVGRRRRSRRAVGCAGRHWSKRSWRSTGWHRRASAASYRSTSRRPSRPCTQLAAKLGVPARFLTAERLLDETARLATPSEIVFRETGCWGVAEGAALAAVGPEGRLLVPKRKGERVTLRRRPGAGRPRSRQPSAGRRAGSPSSASARATCAGARARPSGCWPRPRSWSATVSIST